jgi:hypothetical protein
MCHECNDEYEDEVEFSSEFIDNLQTLPPETKESVINDIQESMAYVMKKAEALGYYPVHVSSRKDKKYMVFDGHKMIHFGQMFYEDYTKHKDEKRRENYIKRAAANTEERKVVITL